MRAFYLSDLAIQETYSIKGDSLHHLVSVVRIERGEELLLLDGKGQKVLTRVEEVSKKEMKLRSLEYGRGKRAFTVDIALGIPKRDALELCLKEATELGVRSIHLIRSAYSQMKAPEPERMERLLTSALEQSNAPFLPEIKASTWEGLPWGDYETVVLLDSQTPREEGQGLVLPADRPHLLVIGPEGGFSPDELSYLHSQDRVRVVNLPTPLLRTPTALAVGVGMMIESLRK